MGLCLTATAVRNVPPAVVARSIVDWCDQHYVVCTLEDSPDHVPADERVQVHGMIDGWTTVLWPTFFGTHDHVATRDLARTLHCVVATAGVHESDVWWHVLYDGERLVDQYVTGPELFAYDRASAREVATAWRGRPDAVAGLLGVPAREVMRLYDRQRRARHYDDWEFTRLWRLMGITYPVNPPLTVPIAATLRIPAGSDRVLPQNQPV